MTARHRGWRNARRIALVGSVLIAALAYGNHRWQQLLHIQGIEQLSWQGLRLVAEGPVLHHLQLERRQADGGRLQISAEGLVLAWPERNDEGWQLPQLRIARLELDWHPPPSGDGTPAAGLSVLRGLAALPRDLTIDAFDIRLPCASGRCPLQGSLQARHAGPRLLPASLELQLRHQGQRLALHADLDGQTDLRELTLQAHLLLNDQPLAQLSTTLDSRGTEQAWQGELAVSGLPETPWLWEWLGQWLVPLPTGAAPPLQAMQLEAGWRLYWPQGPLGLRRLRETARGEARLHARLPEPWPLAGVGLLQGNLALELAGAAGDWLPRQLQADLYLTQPQGTWLEGLPETLRPKTLQLQIAPLAPQPGKAAEDTAILPLSLQLRTQGPVQTALQGELHIAPRQPDWRIELDAAAIKVDAPRLQLSDTRLERLNARLWLSARLDRERLQLALGKASHLDLGQLAQPGLRLERLQSELAGLHLVAEHTDGALHELRLSGPLRLQTQRLSHPRLRPQGWAWQGRLDAGLERQQLNGKLQGERGLGVDLQLQHSLDGTLAVDARLADIFLHAGNPLAETLLDWPTLLELDKGRLQGNAHLRLRPGVPLQGELELRPKGLSGVYDRSELGGLSGHLQARLHGPRLELRLAELEVTHLNPGLPLGPLRLRGQYSASLAQPLRGQLDWQQAELALLGGRAWLAPASQGLSSGSATFAVQLEGLQLGELFRLYPAEGLAGQGILDGRLPLLVGPAGMRIEQGRLANRGPGVLQFRSEKIRALGRANPAMTLVAEALEDFHFGLLSSDLGYDEQGKLRMALRLEGRNPSVEKGRPIHFNINLEEDIPALLTSLQLTDRVNESIRQRVQQSLRKNSDAP